MPCRSDYMNPTRAELDSKETAMLIHFVNQQLGKSTERWIIQAENSDYGNVQKKNDLVVMLCDLCKNMTQDQEDSIIYNARDPISRQLADWWERHLEADRKRISKRKTDKQKLETRKKKLEKELEMINIKLKNMEKENE